MLATAAAESFAVFVNQSEFKYLNGQLALHPFGDLFIL